MIVLKLLQFNFLLLISIYQAVHLISLYLNYYIQSFYIDIIINNIQHIRNTLTVTCENLKIVSFASSRIKTILVSPVRSKFAVKLIC